MNTWFSTRRLIPNARRASCVIAEAQWASVRFAFNFHTAANLKHCHTCAAVSCFQLHYCMSHWWGSVTIDALGQQQSKPHAKFHLVHSRRSFLVFSKRIIPLSHSNWAFSFHRQNWFLQSRRIISHLYCSDRSCDVFAHSSPANVAIPFCALPLLQPMRTTFLLIVFFSWKFSSKIFFNIAFCLWQLHGLCRWMLWPLYWVEILLTSMV